MLCSQVAHDGSSALRTVWNPFPHYKDMIQCKACGPAPPCPEGRLSTHPATTLQLGKKLRTRAKGRTQSSGLLVHCSLCLEHRNLGDSLKEKEPKL